MSSAPIYLDTEGVKPSDREAAMEVLRLRRVKAKLEKELSREATNAIRCITCGQLAAEGKQRCGLCEDMRVKGWLLEEGS